MIRILNVLLLVLPAPLVAQDVETGGDAARRRAQTVEEEVRFEGFEGLELEGTLLVPRSGGERVAAALLLPGSGPTDRNGNQMMLRTNLLAQLAEHLAGEGIATLRFDKRATAAYAGAWPKEVDDQDSFFRWEAFVGDAAAALGFLRGREEVDADRVAVVGHSEGGLIALQLGHDLGEEAPDALVLAATAGRPLDLVVREQVEGLLDRQGAVEEARARHLEALDVAIERVCAGEAPQDDLPIGLRALFPRNCLSLLRSYFTTDPAELARAYAGPVLVVQGDLDAQVSAERDFPRLADALAEREGVPREAVLVEGASHNLKRVESRDEPGFTGPIARQALEAIAGFLRNAL